MDDEKEKNRLDLNLLVNYIEKIREYQLIY